MLFESSFEVSLGLADVDLSTRARHFVYYVRLFLDGERALTLVSMDRKVGPDLNTTLML